MTLARWAGLVVALVVAAVAAIMVGTIHLTPRESIGALFGSGEANAVFVVRSLRLPRMMLAALIGAGLGTSGGALQGALRNPLAEPYLLGVSGGAAVGAVCAVSLHLTPALVPLAAAAGAVSAVVIALFVAHATHGRGDPRVLIMAGVVVGAFANAAIMVLLANADLSVVRGALWWMMGSAADASWSQVAWLAIYVTLGGGLLVAWGRTLDALSLGEDSAAGLGVDVERAARRIYLTASLVAAATVAAAGLVGFVGLVVPHIARRLGATGHRVVLVASALTGAFLVVAADLVARVALPPAELPLGAVTAILGVPFFLSTLRRLT
ncbi:MAG TPA: iron ABC transporter permease [Gemmatimonadaceae bacterium]|nr:iron ABC transporter permease [Gemmatimonadaceae bacterium]